MPPTVILVRHAQALHNQTHNIPDPLLTELGINQCKPLQESLKARLAGETDIAIIASPMRRTLQTAQFGLEWLLERGLRIEADPNWQENSSKPCDTGSPISAVQAEFPSVDFSHVDPVYPDKTSSAGALYAYSRPAIVARGARCLQALYARPEKFVIVVSHSGFLRLGVTGRWYLNANYRVFDFEDIPAGAEEKDPFGLSYRLKMHEDTLAGGLGECWTNIVEIGSNLPEPGMEDAEVV